MLRIKQLREEKGISQLEFAKKINLTQQSVSAYEKGIREPSLDILKTIADFFGVSTDYILSKSDVRNPEKVEVDMDEVDVAFASGIKGLNETNKMIIKSTLEALLAKQEKDKETNEDK